MPYESKIHLISALRLLTSLRTLNNPYITLVILRFIDAFIAETWVSFRVVFFLDNRNLEQCH